MKVKNIISILCAVLLMSVIAGCEDDNKKNYEFFENIAVSIENLQVNPGDGATVDILKGNGGYTLHSTDEEVVTATVQGDKVAISAIAPGNASVVITDAKGVNGLVNVSVYKHLAVETDNVSMEVNQTVYILITSGNGGYYLDNDEESLKVKIEETDKDAYVAVTSDDVQLDKVPITLHDRSGRSVTFFVSVYDPFVEIKEDETLRFDFKGHVMKNDVNIEGMVYFNDTEGGKRRYGWTDNQLRIFWMWVRFPDGDFSVGSKSGAEINYVHLYAPDGDKTMSGGWQPLNSFNIIKNDGTKIWIVFDYDGSRGIVVQNLP